MRQVLGTAVFSGMLGVTLFGLFLTPVFYVVLQGFGHRPTAEPTEPVTNETDAKRERNGDPTGPQGPSADHSAAASDFAQMYQGRPPWDIDKAQPAFIDVADEIEGSVLDVGCGTGENAIFFAERGHKVTGLDFLDQPLQIARQKAAERGFDVEFIQHDALRVDELDGQFDNVLDSGLFHGLSDEDRIQYVAAIGKVVAPHGKLYLQCFSDQEPAGEGPRRVSVTEIRESFTNGWQIVSVKPTRFVVRDDTELNFSDGGPNAWFCVAQRVSEQDAE